MVYVFFVVTGLTAMLMHANMVRSPSRPTGLLLRSGGLLLQALPLMLIMFFLFPRFSSPLWDLGIRENRALTGISDNISPGSVSRLSRSRAVAFRVDFETATNAWPNILLIGRVTYFLYSILFLSYLSLMKNSP